MKPLSNPRQRAAGFAQDDTRLRASWLALF